MEGRVRVLSLTEGPFNDGTCFIVTTLFLSDSGHAKLVVRDYGDGYDDTLVLEGESGVGESKRKREGEGRWREER